MAESKLKKNLNQSIDDALLKCGIDKDVKLFGNPIEDFDLKDLSCEEFKKIKKLLMNKLNTYEV